jgi:hypothetical protein
MKCHTATSKTIPPLAPLMHGIHLAKADASEFVRQFGGECTHCHKLNAPATNSKSLHSVPGRARCVCHNYRLR